MKVLDTLRGVVASKAGLQILKTQKHAPVILFAAGVTGVVATVVLACRATLKLEDILDETEENLEKVKLVTETRPDAVYSENDAKTDTVKIYAQTGFKIAKLYALPVGLGIASIAALTGSHVVLTRRYVGVTAAYAAVHQGLEKYRQRVVAEYGVGKDAEFMYGSVDGETTEIGKDGNPVVKKTKILGGDVVAPYATLFDENTSKAWKREPGYNTMFIQCQQTWANERLNAEGYLFLNDVFESLGMARTKAGQIVGWVKDNDRGDGYIDFGLFRGDIHSARRFINGDEASCWLDFNVDGNILDLI